MVHYEVNIFLDGVRDRTHSADGVHRLGLAEVMTAVSAALEQPAVSSVFVIKRSDKVRA